MRLHRDISLPLLRAVRIPAQRDALPGSGAAVPLRLGRGDLAAG